MRSCQFALTPDQSELISVIHENSIALIAHDASDVDEASMKTVYTKKNIEQSVLCQQFIYFIKEQNFPYTLINRHGKPIHTHTNTT